MPKTAPRRADPRRAATAAAALSQAQIRALTLQAQRRDAEAIAAFKDILLVKPDHPVALYSLAALLTKAQDLDEALSLVDRGVAAAPRFAPMRFARGKVLQTLGHHEDALASYREALELDPAYLDALINSGAVLRELHRHHEALECFNQALTIDGNHEAALGNAGILLSEFKRTDLAIGMFKRLLSINPDYPYGLGLLSYQCLQACDWTDHAQLATRIVDGVRSGRKASKTLGLMAISDKAEDHLLAARIFADQWIPKGLPPLWTGEPYAHERIRIAYVSPDLREHPVGHLMAGVFERHDKLRFETFAISLGNDDGSRLRERMKACFDHFIDVRGQGSRQIAELMRTHEIDIAIDLAGYTSDSRVDVFAHRPAPLQITYLGHPGTLATEHFDYILADRHVIPPEHQRFYTEKVAYLPDSYLPTDGGIHISERTPSRAECGLPESGPVLCSFSHDYKINPLLFGAWMRILQRLPGSVLWLVSRNDLSQANLRREAQARGVDPDRLVFAARVPKIEDHLARYRLADVFLDTSPYNAHTTAADALMAGLPVVTFMGGAFPARVAGSLLHAIGLPELIADSLEGYEELAVALVQDPARLQALKAKLAINKTTHALFDTDRFCSNLEGVLCELAGRPAVTGRAVDSVVVQMPRAVPTPVPAPKNAQPVVVVVPIYKPVLDAMEQFSLDHSLAQLAGRRKVFVGPQGMDLTHYRERYADVEFAGFDAAFFASIRGYNRLLMSPAFYQRFAEHEFMLIVQTDAIVLRDELDHWCAQPFDYVGAPWPDGVELLVNLDQFEGDKGRRVKAMVGNGGLSLRRIERCIGLLAEFPQAVQVFDKTGSSEDLFFSILGTLSSRFVLPNEIVASRFALELKPSYYHAVNGRHAPMGGHAWTKYEPEFWRQFLPAAPLSVAVQAMLAIAA
jgi:protein O-GlcNAc transferase